MVVLILHNLLPTAQFYFLLEPSDSISPWLLWWPSVGSHQSGTNCSTFFPSPRSTLLELSDFKDFYYNFKYKISTMKMGQFKEPLYQVWLLLLNYDWRKLLGWNSLKILPAASTNILLILSWQQMDSLARTPLGKQTRVATLRSNDLCTAKHVKSGQDGHQAAGHWDRSCYLVNRGKKKKEQQRCWTTTSELKGLFLATWRWFLKLSSSELHMQRFLLEEISRGKELRKDQKTCLWSKADPEGWK